MLKKERQALILEKLNKEQRIRVKPLSCELNTSDDTIRRDLDEMEARGLLTKVHGGAVARSGISFFITERMTSDMTAKQRMAQKLVTLFKEGDTMLLDGGTSVLEVAKALPKNMNFTVFTGSFPVVIALFSRPDVKVVFLGGPVDNDGQVTLGIETYEQLQLITPDWSIMGVSDIHPEKGIFCLKQEEVCLKRSMLMRGTKKVIMAGREKLNTARTYRYAGLEDIDYLVTEEGCTEQILASWPACRYKVL